MVKHEFTVMSASLSRPTIRHLSQIRINATSRHFPLEAADLMLILVVPVSSGHLARRLLAGPIEATGNGRSQIRCDGGSPLSSTIILPVQRYLCSSISSPVAAPV